MTQHARGFSLLEFILVALVVGLLLLIIYRSYTDAVLVERRAIAQQGLLTVVALQERWYIRMEEYARTIDEVGGADIAGDHYRLRITQDPCGSTSCFTVTAVAVGDQVADHDCKKMSVNHMGVRRAQSSASEDTTQVCWKST